MSSSKFAHLNRLKTGLHGRLQRNHCARGKAPFAFGLRCPGSAKAEFNAGPLDASS